jgi:phospholipid/cholesterol/gamma-HCH transport system substrate-binding protein
MKLKSFISPFKVGLVVLAGIAAMLYMVTVLTRGEGLFQQQGYQVHAMFDDVTGLAKNSRVMMSGIPVGRLEQMELEGDRVRVVMRIEPDIELHKGVKQPEGDWQNGATITKSQAGVIGDYFLEITPGAAGPVLEDGGQIMNVTVPVGPSQLFERLDSIAGDIEQVTQSMSGVFGGEEGQKRVDQMMTDLQKTLATTRGFVEQNSKKVDRILANAEQMSAQMRRLSQTGSQSLRRILADAESVMNEVKVIVGESSGDVKQGLGTLKGTMARLQTTLDSLNYSLQNVQDITDKINEGEGTIGELVNDPAIANRTERVLEDVENLTNRVDRLKATVGLRSEYHVKHGQLKNVVQLKLQPGPNKYYLAELVDDYRGKTEVIRTDVNTTNADAEDGQYRTTRVETEDSFKFSFQLARSLEIAEWMKVTGRFGLIESTGGLGGNILLTKDQRLDIQADLFDFGADRAPRLRTFASFSFLDYLYVHGGVDDIFNDSRRDYFFGAGIEFTDKDLKALLTTTGVPASGE